MIETRVERIFTFLRACELNKNPEQGNISFNIVDVLFSRPARIIGFLLRLPYEIIKFLIKNARESVASLLRYSLTRFFQDFRRFFRKVTTFTFERTTLGIFFGTFIIFASTAFNVTRALYKGLDFYIGFIIGLILSFIASYFISYTTTRFLKFQGPYIEEKSLLGEISESFSLVGSLIKRAAVSENDLKCAAVIVKRKIDSSVDLLNLAAIFSSVGVVLIAFSFFLDLSEPEALKKGEVFNQETIAKIFAGGFFFCFIYISIFIYMRLQKLRRWSAVLDMAAILTEKK